MNISHLSALAWPALASTMFLLRAMSCVAALMVAACGGGSAAPVQTPLSSPRQLALATAPGLPVLDEAFVLPSAGDTTVDPQQVLAGQASIVGVSSGAEPNAVFLHTDPARLPLQRGHTYTVTFDYRVLAAGTQGAFQFYSRTAGTAGDFLPAREFTGAAGQGGSVSFSSTLRNYDDYMAFWTIGGAGAIVVDGIRITDATTGQLVGREDAEQIALVSSHPRPMQVSSVSFPIVARWYLDPLDPPWVPIPRAIGQMAALGANDVKVTVNTGVYRSSTDNVPDPSLDDGPDDAKLLRFFGQLKAAGLQVTLWPFSTIQFDPNGNLLDSVSPHPADFDAWMDERTARLVRLARIAQQAGVDRFVVFGDNENTLVWDPAHTARWLGLIAQVRSVFSGQITSAAGAGAGDVLPGGKNRVQMIPRPIIDALDVLGVSVAPAQLTDHQNPSVAELVAGLHGAHNGIDLEAFLRNLHAEYGKPILVTDMAFHSFAGDNIHQDWVYDMSKALTASQQEQANELEAWLALVSQLPSSWFLGTTVDSWNRYPPDCAGTSRFLCSDVGENMQGKLAEQVLRQWYGGQRGWGGMQASAAAQGTRANLVVTGALVVSAVDLGKTGNVYVAAALPNGSIYLLSNSSWTLFTGGALPVYSSGALGTHSLPILTGLDVSSYVGTSILIGYGTDQQDLLANRKYMVVYTIN